MVKCTCDLDVSYRDNVVQQIVIHAMRDTDIRGRVISRNTNGELKTIAIAKLIGDCDQWLHFLYALPHHVQDTITGWLSMRPRDTPMIQIGTPTKKARQTHNWCPDYNKEGGCSNTKTVVHIDIGLHPSPGVTGCHYIWLQRRSDLPY